MNQKEIERAHSELLDCSDEEIQGYLDRLHLEEMYLSFSGDEKLRRDAFKRALRATLEYRAALKELEQYRVVQP